MSSTPSVVALPGLGLARDGPDSSAGACGLLLRVGALWSVVPFRVASAPFSGSLKGSPKGSSEGSSEGFFRSEWRVTGSSFAPGWFPAGSGVDLEVEHEVDGAVRARAAVVRAAGERTCGRPNGGVFGAGL